MALRSRRAVKEALAVAFRFSGVPAIVRRTVARSRVSVIAYHDPRPAVLERHLAWLARNYVPIPLDRLGEALHSGDWSGIPSRAVVVTLDDGHRGNVALAPALRRHGVRATLFAVSGVVGTRRHFWWSEVPGDDRESLKWRPRAERERILEERYGHRADRDYSEPDAISAGELAAMADVLDVGAHTRSHPILTWCEASESAGEIAGSKADIEHLTGRPCRHFSYPNGDYGERELATVRAGGYLTARTTKAGWNGRRADPYLLRICGVEDDASLSMLIADLGGFVWLKHRVRNATAWARTARPSPPPPGRAADLADGPLPTERSSG